MDVLVDPNNLIPNVNYRIRTKHNAFGTDHIGTFLELTDTRNGIAAKFEKVSVPAFKGRSIVPDTEYPIAWFNFYETYNNVQKNRILQSVLDKGTNSLIPSSARLGGKRKSRKKTLRRKK